MKKWLFILFTAFTFTIFICSCDFRFHEIDTITVENKLKPIEGISSPDINSRLWNILIYMAADNDLEFSAIEDMYEMEVSKLNTDKVSVFVLLDRSPAYDTSNNNWSDTRLYKLKTGRSENCRTIISEEIPLLELNLYEGSKTELDVSSGEVLTRVLSYVRKKYPAELNGFIMWGHGTGWRSNSTSENKKSAFKGFAYDDTSGTYMSLKQLGESLSAGLNGRKLDFIGLDTCFSGELEVAYEIKDYARYIVGIEGLISVSGWNYENIFNDFQADKYKSPENLINIVIKNFSQDYKKSSLASIVAVNTEYVKDYFQCFDNISNIASENIKDRDTRDLLMNNLFESKNNAKYYSYGEKNSDIYLDVNNMIATFNSMFYSDEKLVNEINKFMECKKKCILNNWASDKDEGGLGVFFGTMTEGNMIGSVHPNAYIKNNNLEHITFVNDSNGYVYDIKNENGLIYKLFYANYNF